MAISRLVWVDANTDIFLHDIEGGKQDNWCEDCQEHTAHIQLKAFKGNIENWWNHLEPTIKEETVNSVLLGLKTERNPGSVLTFAGEYWGILAIGQKYKIWLKHRGKP